MNKLLILSAIFLTGLISCQPNPPIPPIKPCLSLEQDSGWITEDFKKGHDVNYRIQFPNTYTGEGLHFAAESLVFIKNRNDGLVSMFYRYCNEIDECFFFGQPIPYKFPKSIMSKDANLDPVTLDKHSAFCVNGELVSVLYYNDVQASTGKLYMLHDSTFVEALNLLFDKSALPEVERILQTINEN